MHGIWGGRLDAGDPIKSGFMPMLIILEDSVGVVHMTFEIQFIHIDVQVVQLLTTWSCTEV
jgi:hypothetical protein